MEPTPEQWRELYAAAQRFFQTAPWDWMTDEDVFGVQDPETGEIGYCCVLGELREVLALTVYRGSAGLEGLWRLFLTPDPTSFGPAEVLSWQNCLMASFEDRENLQPQDRSLIRTLELKFRGRQAWPMFRSYLPEYMPWFVDAAEARFLTICLEQTIEMAARLRENPGLLPDLTPSGPYLVRVLSDVSGGRQWQDTLVDPAPLPPPSAPPALPGELLRELRALPTEERTLEAGHTFLPGSVNEKPRPICARVVVVTDAESGYVLGNEIAAPGQLPAALSTAVTGAITKLGHRPERIAVPDDESVRLLLPLASSLGIELKRSCSLPMLESCFEALTEWMAGG